MKSKKGFLEESKLCDAIPGARVESNKYGKFVSVERGLDYFKDNPIYHAINEYGGSLKQRFGKEYLATLFPEATRIYRQKLLVFDIENCGLNPNNPIFMIAMAHVNGGINPELLLAPDPSSEPAILQAFLDRIKEYKYESKEDKTKKSDFGFITYNGHSFDIPRLTGRARHNGIFFNGNSDLGEWIEEEHFDLYNIAKKPEIKGRLGLRRVNLTNVERALCRGETREDDISGELIPQMYREFVYGEDLEGKSVSESRALKNLNRVVDHNFLDVLSPISFLGYLLSSSKQKVA